MNLEALKSRLLRIGRKEIVPVALERAHRVGLISKKWYDSYNEWLKGGKFPGQIKNLVLYEEDGQEIQKDIVEGTDYVIVQFKFFETLEGAFTCDKKIVKLYALNPDTDEPEVIFTPKKIKIDLDGEIISKNVAQWWTLAGIARSICKAKDLDPNIYEITENPPNHGFSEKLSYEEYHSRQYKGELVIKKSHSKRQQMNSEMSMPPSPRGRTSELPGFMGYSSTLMSPRSLAETERRTSFRRFTATMPPSPANPLIPVQTTPNPCGFTNMGNICYFNATVQCMLRIHELTEQMFVESFEEHLNRTNRRGTHGVVATAYRKLLCDVCTTTTSPKNLNYLRQAIAGKYRQFANYDQHDASELLIALLDALHEDINPSPITDIFQGTLETRTICPVCNGVSSVEELFTVVHVQFPKRRLGGVSLLDCFSATFSEDVLDKKNLWHCDKCNTDVQARKCNRITKTGKIVVFIMKRFTKERFSSKIDKSITYPDTLNGRDFSDVDGVFDFVGAIYHQGSLHFGHYTSAAGDKRGSWYSFNDTSCRKILQSNAHQGNAYILFYRKR